jgi:hypothetical protein
MSDIELTRALERCELPNAGFHHADHLRVALVYLNESPTIGDAIDRMAATLRRFAASVGQPQKYSQATTEFWMHQVAAVRAVMPDASADALFAAFPRLLDKRLILAYTSDDATATGTAHSPRDTPNRSLSGGAA